MCVEELSINYIEADIKKYAVTLHCFCLFLQFHIINAFYGTYIRKHTVTMFILCLIIEFSLIYLKKVCSKFVLLFFFTFL
jgi:hypothetical protein